MRHIPYLHSPVSAAQAEAESKKFYEQLNARRSVRFFSNKPVQKTVIENVLKAAGTAPSGAHKQPWYFCAISNAGLKTEIRKAAEIEEKAFYTERATKEWLRDLEPFGTDWRKPFLEIAPWLIVVFKESYTEHAGKKSKNYYVQESVGIACGMLIAAIHQAGLSTLTHTPSPMGFLSKILNRPENQKPFLLLPIGYPAANATVPDLARKPLAETTTFFE